MTAADFIPLAVTWEGLDEANAALRSIGHNASQNLYPEIRRILKPYRKEFRKDIPKGKTGNLRKSLDIKVSERAGVIVFTSKAGNKQGHHGHLVYKAIGRAGAAKPYGPPNPFLHRTLERHMDDISEGIAKQIEIWFAKAAAVRSLR